MNRILVLQHIACEPPAIFEDVLRERGAVITRVEVDEQQPIPDPRDFTAVVAMGGPMSAYDDDTLPWLRREREVIREAVHAGMPYWGVCLGAQLLAAALGARVYPAKRPEVGICRVETAVDARDDVVFRAAPQQCSVLQWHSDTFDLPARSRLLAGSTDCPHQAFAYRRAYGLQFHLEVTPDLVGEWARVPSYEASLREVRGPGALDRLAEEVTAHAAETGALARSLFTRWLDHVVTPWADGLSPIRESEEQTS